MAYHLGALTSGHVEHLTFLTFLTRMRGCGARKVSAALCGDPRRFGT